MLEVLKGEPLLANSVSEFAQMTNPLVTRPRTKFQERGIRLGHGVWDLVFQRQR
jgi:tRNA (guanine-N7-)-methyltransferase